MSRNIMIREAGQKTSFRCDCGCNVFHHPDERPDRYECNSCGARYHEVVVQSVGGAPTQEGE